MTSILQTKERKFANTSSQFKVLPNTSNEFKVNKFLNNASTYVTLYLKKKLRELGGIRFNLQLVVTFTDKDSGKDDIPYYGFHLKHSTVTHVSEIGLILPGLIAAIETKVQEFDGKGYNMNLKV